jgi:hypothetical protein
MFAERSWSSNVKECASEFHKSIFYSVWRDLKWRFGNDHLSNDLEEPVPYYCKLI